MILDTLQLMEDMHSQSLEACDDTRQSAQAQLLGIQDKMHGLLINWLEMELKIVKARTIYGTASLDEIVKVARPLALLKGRHKYISYVTLKDIVNKHVTKTVTS